MKSGETADGRDEALGLALREAAGRAAASGDVDFEAVYAAAERPGPGAARRGSPWRSRSPILSRVSVRRLALALPLAAAACLAIVAGLGEAARSRGFRDEIAFLSRRVVGPDMAAALPGPGGLPMTEALYRVPGGGVAGATGGPAGDADAAAAAGAAPTELSLFVEGLWREGPAAGGASGEAAEEAGAEAPSF